MASNYDIEIVQGIDLVIPFLLEDAKGNLQDLSGYSIKLQIKTSSYSKKFIDELSTDNKRILLKEDKTNDQATSKGEKPKSIIECSWPHEVTEKLPVGKHVYEIEISSPGNTIFKLLEGSFIVKQEIVK